MSTKQLYEKTSEGMKEVSPLVSIEDIYSKLSDTPLEALVSLFNHVKCEWKGSVSDTRRTVPLFLRRSGLFITYNNGTKYITEFFSAGTDQITTEGWVKDSNWTSVPDEDYISAGVKPGVGTIGYEQLNDNLKQLFREKVNVTNFPDDEDIASVDNMLKLKDREADAAKFQSKGYVILRKNLRLVNGVVKNILTQDMISKPNTIYEIRYDFDLNGQNIKVPNNSTIKFVGGSFNNGELNPNDCYVVNDTNKCIFNNIVINKDSKFSDKLEFLDYWVDNFPRSKVLHSISKFSFTRSWEFSIQSDFVNSVPNRGSVIIEGNGHSLIINTDTWEKPKSAIKLLQADSIDIYNLKIIQEQPTSLVVDAFTVYFDSRIFRFINSYYHGFCRLNCNWSKDRPVNGVDEGLGSELLFQNSHCEGYSFISEGRFDKVNIISSSIFHLDDNSEFVQHVWGRECLSIGANSSNYKDKSNCYINIVNSRLKNFIEEVSCNFIFNDDGTTIAQTGADGIVDKGYPRIDVNNCDLNNFSIIPEGSANNGKWFMMNTIVTYSQCRFYKHSQELTTSIATNSHERCIFNDCTFNQNIKFLNTHNIEFNNCNFDGIAIYYFDFRIDISLLTTRYTNCVFRNSSFNLKGYNSFNQILEKFFVLNCMCYPETSCYTIINNIRYVIPFTNAQMYADDMNLKALTNTDFQIKSIGTFGTNIDNYSKKITKLLCYNSFLQQFFGIDGTSNNYITY